MPLLSVIIPVYNCEKYLAKCLDSILAQTMKDWELILIDDGSSDSSGVICDKYKSQDNRIKVIHKMNEGPSIARNVGLQKIKGQWVHFIDSDDWIDENHFECLINSVQQNNAELIFFGYKRCFAHKILSCKLPERIFTQNPDEIYSSLATLISDPEQFFGYTWNKLFKCSIIKDNHICFPENLKIKEDEVFTLEYCKYVSSLLLLDITSYNYRFVSSSLSHCKYTEINYSDLIILIISLLKSFKKTSVYKAFMQRIFYYYLDGISKLSEKKEVKKIILEFDNFYQMNKQYLLVSNSFKFLFRIPSKYLRIYILMYVLFYLKR